MDRRFIFIPIILFASVLLLSGFINGIGGQGEPAPDNNAGENDVSSLEVPSPEVPVSESKQKSVVDESSVADETEQEMASFSGFGGASATPKVSSSISSEPEKDDNTGNTSENNTGNTSENNTGNTSEKTCPSPQEIPEFPTIALPMLAIVGLALIFRRK